MLHSPESVKKSQEVFLENASNCNFAEYSSIHLFRLFTQTVCISELNFTNSSFRVSTTLTLHPTSSRVTQIVLNLGNKCILPGEKGYTFNKKITINGIPAKFIRNRFIKPLIEQPETLIELSNAYSKVEADHPGDLIIYFPKELLDDNSNQKVITIFIDLLVVGSNDGIHFVVPNIETLEGAHVYTKRSNVLSSTLEWLPTLDSPDQLALWKFEFTIEKHLTAVGCGDLLDTTKSVEDDDIHTFHYRLLIPTAARNVGFAIGEFQSYSLLDLSEIVSYVFSKCLPLVKHTINSIYRPFTFFEEILSCRFPYGSYRQVFVDQLPENFYSFAGLSILSIRILYHKKILDTLQSSRELLALSITQQFFGCFLNPVDFDDLWLTRSLASLVAGLYNKKCFGNAEHVYKMDKIRKEICTYEKKYGQITLSRKNSKDEEKCQNRTYFDRKISNMCPSSYTTALFKKGHIVLAMLQKKCGEEEFLKILRLIIKVASENSQRTQRPVDWFHMNISSKSFFRALYNTIGRDYSVFLDDWVYSGGHVNFEVVYTFNRKLNKLEIEFRQVISQNVSKIYMGPINIMVQELDGFFTHTVHIDAQVSKHDLPCHSKCRKQKKKRVLLSTEEEVEIDLTQMDADSPVLWIRIDAENLILRDIKLTQQIHQWECILLHERDVVAQFEALHIINEFPIHQTYITLLEAVKNEKFFYRVRILAAQYLANIANRLPDGLIGLAKPFLVSYFQQNYCCKTELTIPRSNNYVITSSNLQQYFIMKGLLLAMGKLKLNGGLNTNLEVLKFIVDLIHLNDNSLNRYSDDFYRASLIKSLGNMLVPVLPVDRPSHLSTEGQCILNETIHALNIDTLKPSFGKIISIRCLEVLQKMQYLCHLPLDLDIFWNFALNRSIFSELRICAYKCIIALIEQENAVINKNIFFLETLIRILREIQEEADPYIRESVTAFLGQQTFPYVGGQMNEILSAKVKELKNIVWIIISNPTSDLFIPDIPGSMESIQNLERKIIDLTVEPMEEKFRKATDSESVLSDLETHARSISSNLDMTLRDLRGSLRGMSDLTLESNQAFVSAINSTCDNVDTAIKLIYTMLARTEELNTSMKEVHKLANKIKEMKILVDLFESNLANESSSQQYPENQNS